MDPTITHALEWLGYRYDTPDWVDVITTTRFSYTIGHPTQTKVSNKKTNVVCCMAMYCTSTVCNGEIYYGGEPCWKPVPTYVEYCPDCNERLLARSTRNPKHIPPNWNDKVFDCAQCGITFPNYVTCRRHLYQRHGYLTGF